MKIILSVDPIKYPLTGIGRYTFELAKALACNDQVASLLFFHGLRLGQTLPKAAPPPSVLIALFSKLLKNRISFAAYRRIVPRAKGMALRGFEDYVYHGPNYYLPPFGGRSVVTIHDLSTYSLSACHPPARVRHMQEEITSTLSRATILLTDSEFTRQEVATHFGWPLAKVHAVPLASAAEFHPREPSKIAPLLGQYGLVPLNYSLFVGTIEPRKNLDRLLDAYALLPKPVRIKWPLVLAGYRGWSSSSLHSRIQAAQDAGWARYLDFVPARHLPALYAGARLFIYPSLYEGFGLPVLEAMASGTPVVCSTSSSLPEVAGDAAALCDPFDVETLGQLIATGLQDEPWQRVAANKGLIQAARFSWRRCAHATLAAYQMALKS